ncbi:hypothetical protein SPRG_07028 [Saprolegnia parasitica CBS 223.65]|uniref:Fatty acid hydroxylase domain-containing protein n=1 Tax=Saprolegnia parasitica (strain CBS 223.65) TaxID=695850 RepID=A0A067CE28_SAPPC|nr:hypothetical protein SPRG_07028 [Saprolegnia parasitica CBS 223.65]KDO27440.1 hypothetical protein SPRG_07028 [Saprolegnia parasitica CBS 223.65]|eukprot:XP_012201879.1 hypothetical protein SPRG_07028 [Saprolegnia parasitica CBS 223.65]
MATATTIALDWIERYDNLDLLEPYWAALQARCSDFTIYFWCTLTLSTLALFGGSLVYALMDATPALRKYKIQPTKPPTIALYLRCLKLAVGNHLLIHMGLLWVNLPLMQWLGISVSSPLPKPSTIALQFVVCMLTEDFCFYWCHRFLHWKRIYKHVHKVHHEYRAPFGLTAVYTHPLEEILTTGATMAGPLLVCRHMLPIWIWTTYRLLETIDSHSGFEFPLAPGHLIPILSGTLRHDYHHEKFDCNFGSMFSFWDWVCGTDAAFREVQRAKAAKGEPCWLDVFDYLTPGVKTKTV